MNTPSRFQSSFSNEQRGQAIVLIALFFLAMLMIAGLAVDAGQLYVAKRTMQEAADAAAFAGGVVVYQGGTTSASGVCGSTTTDQTKDAWKAARDDANTNGFTDGINGVTLTINNPPLSGASCGDAKYTEVIIVQQVRTTLVPAQSVLNPVRARGVGGANPAKSPFALMMLKTTGPCLTMIGSGGIDVPSGPDLGGLMQANCSGTSIQLSGTGGITDYTGVRTVGSISQPARVNPPAQAGVVTGAPAQPDPFAGFPKPPLDPPATTFTNYSVPGTYCAAPFPLTPGTYINGIVNAQNCDIILGSGVFILKGGGFQQNASSGNVITVGNSQTLGAFIFNTHTNYAGPIGSGTCGAIAANSGGGFNTWAMGSGLYAGMAFYQDAACTNTISISSNGAYFFHGTFYAPTATLSLQSQSGMTLESQIVVYSIDMQSNGTLTVNYHPSLSASSGLPTLVE